MERGVWSEKKSSIKSFPRLAPAVMKMSAWCLKIMHLLRGARQILHSNGVFHGGSKTAAIFLVAPECSSSEMVITQAANVHSRDNTRSHGTLTLQHQHNKKSNTQFYNHQQTIITNLFSRYSVRQTKVLAEFRRRNLKKFRPNLHRWFFPLSFIFH